MAWLGVRVAQTRCVGAQRTQYSPKSVNSYGLFSEHQEL